MKRGLIVLLFCLIVALSNLSSVNGEQAKNEDALIKEIMERQAYKWKRFSDKRSMLEHDSFFDFTYGGVYFKEEKLFINVKKNNLNDLKNKLQLDIEYELVEVEYSLKELENVKKKLINNADILSIRGIGIDEVNNMITVQTELPEDFFISLLNKNIDHEMLDIQLWKNELSERTIYTVNGRRINIGIDSIWFSHAHCTIGFAAKDSNGNPGIVTAGHCTSNFSSGKNVYYEGDHAGDTRDYIHNEGTVDAGFIELRDPWGSAKWLPSRDLVFGGSYNYVSTGSYYAVGSFVEFRGTYGPNQTVTNDIDYGEITDTSFDWIDSSGFLKNSNMIEVDVVTHSGDSGGPLLISIYIGEGFYEMNVIGILSGGDDFVSVFSKTSDILPMLDVTPY